MKILFIVLAHKEPVIVERLLNNILADKDFFVVLHYDLKSPEFEIANLAKIPFTHVNRLHLAERIDIQWGEWSMIQATLNCLKVAFSTDWEFDYVYLLSAVDYPIKPLSLLKRYLTENIGQEFIESFSADQQQWVAGGIQQERYELWHYINWRRNPKLFNFSLYVQKRLSIKRRPPEGHRVYIGSQWWVLTRDTCKKLLELSENKKITDFYKRVWVPDEIYFQTLVRTVVPDNKIKTYSLTFYEFTDYGVPVVYYNGHEEYLANQNFFFARKLSNFSCELRDSLDQINNDIDRLAGFDLKNVGTKNLIYSSKRSVGRSGFFGKRKIGHVRDAWYGDLEWNVLPFFVIYGDSSNLLKFFQKIFNKYYSNILCHGFLFNENYIDFFEERQKFAGYRKADYRLRDHSRQTFLSQVIQENGTKISGYLLNSIQKSDLLDIHMWDSNATVFLINESPMVSYKELYGYREDSDYEATNYFNYCKAFFENRERIKKNLIKSGGKFYVLDLINFIDPQERIVVAREIARLMGGKLNEQVVACIDSGADINYLSRPIVPSKFEEVEKFIARELADRNARSAS